MGSKHQTSGRSEASEKALIEGDVAEILRHGEVFRMRHVSKFRSLDTEPAHSAGPLSPTRYRYMAVAQDATIGASLTVAMATRRASSRQSGSSNRSM